jgi:hypothetical protein
MNLIMDLLMDLSSDFKDLLFMACIRIINAIMEVENYFVMAMVKYFVIFVIILAMDLWYIFFDSIVHFFRLSFV